MRWLIIVITAVLVCFLPRNTQAQFDNAVTVLSQYFDLLETGNFETAELMWAEGAQERSSRFGIEYSDIPLRIDCVSPVIRNYDIMSKHLQKGARKYEDLDGELFGRATFSAVIGSELIEHYYYMQLKDGYYWLIYPQDFYARSWPISESEYFRLHVDPVRQSTITEQRLKAADELFEKLASKLKLSNRDIALFKEKKIEFFYCSSDSVVSEITGHRVRGTLDLASSDIISASFPHLHELTHLLVNFKLKKLPLYTLPLFREGVAVRYGGRWGKDEAALFDLGAYLHQNSLVEIDSMLTMSDFGKSSIADISYPVAGVFVLYLLEKLGDNKFFELYREFSGSFLKVSAFSGNQVKQKILDAVRIDDWKQLLSDFDRFMIDWPVRNAVAKTGEWNNGDREIASSADYKVLEGKRWYSFEFAIPDSSFRSGSLLFDTDETLQGTLSELFVRQFANRVPFGGQRFGVRFDRQEAGLYEYHTGRLVAKYITGISPTDGYFDPDTGVVRISFAKSLFDGWKPSKNDFTYLQE